jgi:hypothetical protein
MDTCLVRIWPHLAASAEPWKRTGAAKSGQMRPGSAESRPLAKVDVEGSSPFARSN